MKPIHTLIALVILCFAIAARAEMLGKDAPTAPTALVDVSEEAFADALGLSEKPEPTPGIPKVNPVDSAIGASNKTLLDKITGPEVKTARKNPAAGLNFDEGPVQGQVQNPLDAGPMMMAGPPRGYASGPMSYVPVPVPTAGMGGGGDVFIVVNNGNPVNLSDGAKDRDVAATDNKNSILTPFSEPPKTESLLADAAKTAANPPVPTAPATPPSAPPTASNVPSKSVAMPAMAGVPDVAIILTADQFFPARVRLKQGSQTRLLFTTTNSKPAALVIEKLDVQKWVASPDKKQFATELERAQYELNRELALNRVTEVMLLPKPGVYSFHDALSGAAGEIVVE